MRRTIELRCSAKMVGARVTGCVLAALMFGGLALPGTSEAATSYYRWTGLGTTPNWPNSSNWLEGTSPAGSVGTLAFPVLLRGGCSQSPPRETCYDALDDAGPISANQVVVTGNDYGIVPAGPSDTLAIGAGGLQVDTADAYIFDNPAVSPVISVPITLTSPQLWLFDTSPGEAPLVNGGISGPVSDSLGIVVPADSAAALAGSVDVGPLTIATIDASFLGVGNPAVVLDGGDLNGVDRETVTFFGGPIEDDADVTTGPLLAIDGSLFLGGGGAPLLTTPVAVEWSVNGSVNFTGRSAISFAVTQDGTSAGTDFSQLQASGSINLDDVGLGLSNNVVLPVGEVLTLVKSTGGSVTGTFNGIPNGATVETGAGNVATINYLPNEVTATITS